MYKNAKTWADCNNVQVKEKKAHKQYNTDLYGGDKYLVCWTSIKKNGIQQFMHPFSPCVMICPN